MAIAEANARFTISLDDKVSGPSMNAAKATDELKKALIADKKALNDMNRAMKDMQSGSSVNLRAAQELRQKIELKKQAISEASGKLVEMGGNLNLSAAKMQKTQAAASGVTSGMGLMGAGVMGLSAAFVALAAAVGIATVSLARYALTMANSRRDEAIQLEGLSKIRDWYGRAATSAGDLQKYMDEVSGSTALGRGQINQYTESLYRMGLRGENLRQALKGVSQVASVQGDKEAGLFMSMAAGAAFAGQSVKRLADDVEARIGDTARKKMLSLDVQAMKLRENFEALFHGLQLGKFLSAINNIVQMFSQAEETGRAWKVIMEALFQPLFDGLGTGTPLVKRFIQGITIAVLSLIIVVVKAKQWLWDTFGIGKWTSGIDMGTVAIWAGYAAVGALTVALILMVAPILAITAAMATMGAILAFGLALALVPVALLAAALYGLWEAVKFAWDKMKEFGSWFMNYDWASLGKAVIDGIINGLKNGAGYVVDSMKSLGNSAISSFKEALGIHSPSRVFAEAGINITRGVSQGVEEGAPQANASVASMMTVPSVGAGAAISNNSPVVNITVNAQGGDAASIAQAVQDAVTRVLEGMAVSMGATNG